MSALDWLLHQPGPPTGADTGIPSSSLRRSAPASAITAAGSYYSAGHAGPYTSCTLRRAMVPSPRAGPRCRSGGGGCHVDRGAAPAPTRAPREGRHRQPPRLQSDSHLHAALYSYL